MNFEILPELFAAAFLSYLLGSINSSIVVSKCIYQKDIRNFGSGNAGATNTLRTFGKLAAVLVVLGDIVKGIVAVIIGSIIADKTGFLVGGFFAIVGHNWPIYFSFKGGKGILTSLAVVFTIDWRIGLGLTIIGVGLIVLFRYVSLGSVMGCVLFPLAAIYFPNLRGIPKNQFIVFSFTIALIAIIRHRSNIARLIKGCERRIGEKSKITTV